MEDWLCQMSYPLKINKSYLLKRYLPIVKVPFLFFRHFVLCIHISITLLKQLSPDSSISLKQSQRYLGSKYRESPSTCIYYLPNSSPSFTHLQGHWCQSLCYPTLYAYLLLPFSSRSVRVAERLALPTSDHGVAGSNPAGGEILPETKRRFIAQSLSCSPFHRLEMTEIGT